MLIGGIALDLERKENARKQLEQCVPSPMSLPQIINVTSLYASLQVEPIEVDDLKKDKLFAKLLKKFQKESEELKKKHQKQRDSIQKQQVCTSHFVRGCDFSYCCPKS